MKRIVSMLLSLAVVIGTFPMISVFADDVILKGSGTADSPYRISTAEELNKARDMINDGTANKACFELTDDIDLKNVKWEQIGWFKKGNDSTATDYYLGFEGTFDGNGHAIENFTIDTAQDIYVGFFGFLSGATVLDWGLEGVNITANAVSAGCLVGLTQNKSTIRGCYVKNSSCKQNSAVNYGFDTAALVAHMQSESVVENSYAYNVKICGGRAGCQTRFVGKVDNKDIVIKNCYTAKCGLDTEGVADTTWVPPYTPFAVKNLGIVLTKSVENCYADGTAIAGNTTHNPDIYKEENYLGIQGATKEGIVTAMTKVGYAVDEKINDGYQCFTYESGWDGKADSGFDGGEGTESNPYKIATPGQLAYFRDTINNTIINDGGKGVYYELTDDINLNNQEWTPIGIFSRYQPSGGDTTTFYEIPFKGKFNGNKHIISNFKITDLAKGDSTTVGSTCAGLFGQVSESGTIKNLGVENATITTQYQSNVGAVTGELRGSSSVHGCYVKNTIVKTTDTQSSSAVMGGMVGHMYNNASISNSYVYNVTVHGARMSYTGGFAGYVETNDAKIENCYAANVGRDESDAKIDQFSLSFHPFAGIENRTPTFTNCYSTAVFVRGYQNTTTLDTSAANECKSGEVQGNSNKETIVNAFKSNGTFTTNDAINAGYPSFAWEKVTVVDDITSYVVAAVSGTDKVKVTILENTKVDDAVVYVASYNDTGRLVACEEYNASEFKSASDNTVETTVSATNADKVKVFVWNGNQVVLAKNYSSK